MNITFPIVVDGKEYTFKQLTALEWGNIMDTALGQQAANRKLVALSSGIDEKVVEALPMSDFTLLLGEYLRVNTPKGQGESTRISITSPKPQNT